MGSENPDIVVLRRTSMMYGVRAGEYLQELRDRLPDYNIEMARTEAEEEEMLPEATVVTGMELTQRHLDLAENLKMFHCGLAGIEHLPLDEIERRGVAVTNASGVHGPNIAEHVIGTMLMFARRLHIAWEQHQQAEWRHFRAFDELKDSTVTVVGMGAVGQAIIERLQAFEANVIGVRYTPSKGGNADEVIGFDKRDLHDALAKTDYLVIASRLTETTQGLIGREEINTLHQDAVLINIARGKIVDTDTIVEALQCNQLHGAALDVVDPEPLPPDHPLWTLDNVLITPHSAGDTPEFWRRVADVVEENMERIAGTGHYRDLRNQVVTPQTTTPDAAME